MPSAKPLVRATQIGEYIRHHSCERRFKLDFNDRELTHELPFFFQLSGTMDPVLQEAGRRREREWEGRVREAGLTDLCRYDQRPGASSTAWGQFQRAAEALRPGTAGFGREIEVEAELGGFRVSGRIDFVLVLWDGDRPRLRIVECKASRKDRTYHRVQLVLYRMLLRKLLAELPLVVGGRPVETVECVVARIDETTNQVFDVLELPPLDLEMEEADVARLLQPGGALARILDTDLEALSYQLDSRCGDCAMHVHCLPESARQRRIELLGVDPSAVRAFRAAGLQTLDDVAELDPAGPIAQRVRADAGFREDLHSLVTRARTRRRLLPGGDLHPDDHEVEPLPHAGNGQLPKHDHDGHALVRVFLSVHYDYVENRIGALAAHVTRSDHPLSSLFQGEGEGWRPDPDVKEQWKVETDGDTEWQEGPVRGEDVIGWIREPWTGDYLADNGKERLLLRGFFQKIVEAVQRQAPEGWAPIHFYIWNRGEITRLVEGCTRCGTELLSHLRELLGCRANLEQLIYSCLEDEVHSRFALGWTSRGLGVATSLKWFGRRFHWTRMVKGEVVHLDRVFFQDLFDWKTSLRFDGDRAAHPWRALDDEEAARHPFEIRGCFQDALSAPYWRAVWGTLPDPAAPGTDPRVAKSIRRYQEAGKPPYLRAYLQARVQALRWIEESVRFKNDAIEKVPLCLDNLLSFSLGVDGPARAALDFLRLEQHVKVNDWIAGRLVPPIQRVAEGGTLPLRDLKPIEKDRVEAWIDLTGYPIDRAALEVRCSYAPGAFVRVCPCPDDPARAQTLGQLTRGGSTGTIESLDWETGRLVISVIPSKGAAYLMASRGWKEDSDGYTRATVDESPSDFVSSRVDRRLRDRPDVPTYGWFDPCGARVPAQDSLPAATSGACRQLLEGMDFGKGTLAPDQVRACLEGLGARVQLLQGPPGTGKTQTTAAAALLRILARRSLGDLVLLTGNTHTAVDTLLARIRAILPLFQAHARAVGLTLPPVRLVKIHSSEPANATGEGIEDMGADTATKRIEAAQADAVVILGGTPAALLKLEKKLSLSVPHRGETHGFQAPLLIVDEASMMVLPCFLAMASLVREDGEILLAGDHRQLSPIVGHDWANEDRPPAVLYQPYVSAYEAVRNLAVQQGLSPAQIAQSALSYTFRLPAEIRDLLARLYRQDGIELSGRVQERRSPGYGVGWDRLWDGSGGLFLVTHDERTSKQSNPVEAEIIRSILQAGAGLGKLAPGSVGIVMPHRAQRSLLKGVLAEHGAAVDVLDTVERLQGGERETIIVSATTSDPAAIGARAEFILSLNRANVAFSRAKQRLIVVCAETLLSYIPVEVEHYEAAVLWKSLRVVCGEPVGELPVGEHLAVVRAAGG
ncbi:MAG: hypothetical protein K0Q72_1289 [Armatimonadetes bacterium]|nr:hypothetical protein [Armatimonadota bacterium]